MSLTNDTMLTMPVVPSGYGGNGGGFGFGGDNAWWIVLFLIFGWGRNGFGNGFDGMNGGVGSEVQRGFDHSSVVQKLDGITQGICDSTYALNNTIVNGFNGVERSICNVGYQTQAGFNSLAHQLSDCCCTTQRAIDSVRYDMATQACDTRNAIQNSTRDILESNNSNTRAILDFLTQDKIATLTAENQNLKLAASQANQNAYISATIDAANATLIRRLGVDCPQPAYLVNAPTPVNFPVNSCGQVVFGGNGCGNGCF